MNTNNRMKIKTLKDIQDTYEVDEEHSACLAEGVHNFVEDARKEADDPNNFSAAGIAEIQGKNKVWYYIIHIHYHIGCPDHSLGVARATTYEQAKEEVDKLIDGQETRDL